MALIDQKITDKFAMYNGDCCEVVAGLPSNSIYLSVYSPPFCGLYNYSSDDRDMSNSLTYDAFYDHYDFLIKELARVTMPGRITAVHAMDIPNPGQKSGYHDLPGRIIALHEKHGFYFFGRTVIWKEPLRVAIRTRLKHLTHKQLVKDSTHSTFAAGDVLMIFKKKGDNQIPVTHEGGFTTYAGATPIPEILLKYRGTENQAENKLSHWIWRRYASCIWDDIRVDRTLPYKAARDPEDEKHVHPLQLDVIDRAVALWSNPGEKVLTPFMGVGSEVYGAIMADRLGIGVELKTSYFNQAVKNIEAGLHSKATGEIGYLPLFHEDAEDIVAAEAA